MSVDCVCHLVSAARNTLEPSDYKVGLAELPILITRMLHENHTRAIGFDDGESLSHFGSPMNLP